MCAVSMISDHYNQPYQNPMPAVLWPAAVPPTLPWTPDSFADLKEILKRLDALDKKLGLAHCDDPKKAKWMKAIEKRLKKIEKAKV